MRRKIVAAGVAALAVAGAGAAVAATSGSTPQDESKAVVDDAAQQLGVSSTALSDALKKAFEDRVDASVAAGTITKAEGDAIKSRIESQDYPMLAGPGFGHYDAHGFGHLGAAATYLGLTEAELQTQLAGGKTLADVVKAQGKTVDGLVAALVADEKKQLAAAVSAERLTQTQADAMLANAQQRFTDMVNGTMPGGPPGFAGPPPAGATAAFLAPVA